VIQGAITPTGFKDLAIIAGSSDTLHAIDTDTGKLLWKKKFTVEGTPKREPHWLCPNALNATPVIDKRTRTVFLITSDGKLRSLNVVNGEDRAPPVPFVPEFSKNWSLNLVNNVIYTAVSQGCNGAKSAVYSIDLNDPKRPVYSFLSTTTGGAGIWGRAGVAITSTGLVFGETGDGPWDPPAGKYSDTVLALSAKDLKLADYYTPANRAWITRKDLDMGCISPTVFKFQQWELVAASGKEGVIYLLDSKAPGGADHRTPLYRSPLLTNEDVDFAGRGFWGALSTWEDAKGTRWLLAPAWGPPASTAPKFPLSDGETPNGSIMAFKVVMQDGKPALEAAWNSRDMSVPEPVIIANGLVLALSNGENVRQVDSGGRLLSSKERATTPIGNATLYALDAETGKVLYSSGKTIPSWTHFSGIALSNGRIFAVTHDGNVYAFGLGLYGQK
jgi:outer membrane protein assembly factor BamB